MGGSNVAGAALLTRSLVWLLVAVVIKGVSFACLERRLSWPKAVCFMLTANVLSTIPGLLTATLAGSVVLLALPIMFGLGVLAQRRLSALPQDDSATRFSRRGLALAFTLAFIVSAVLFSLAGMKLDAERFASYWIIKLLFVTIAATTGMAISTVLEEYAVGILARKSHGQIFFYKPVLRANYITLGMVLLVSACEILPRRLAAPHFIVSWVQAVSSFLGLA
jgi:hypothetical protein